MIFLSFQGCASLSLLPFSLQATLVVLAPGRVGFGEVSLLIAELMTLIAPALPPSRAVKGRGLSPAPGKGLPAGGGGAQSS